MMKIHKHIEIVSTTQSGLSSMSQRSRNAILATLRHRYTKVGITIVNNLSDLEALVALKPDIIFLGMKFLPVNPSLGFHDTNKIWISDYLYEHDIAHTGSDQRAHRLELNKPLAKKRVLDTGLKTSPFYVTDQGTASSTVNTKLVFPLFVKPTNRGGGLGIDKYSVVYTRASLSSKVLSIMTKYHSSSLVEQYLPGREFSVAILKHQFEDSYAVMPIELVAEPNERGHKMLSSAVKSSDSEKVLAVTDSILKDKINTLALEVFHALGARDYGRIDIRLDQYGTPHFLEANLIPSLIDNYGSFPKACLINENLSYAQMIFHITQLVFDRLESEENPKRNKINPAFQPALAVI